MLPCCIDYEPQSNLTLRISRDYILLFVSLISFAINKHHWFPCSRILLSNFPLTLKMQKSTFLEIANNFTPFSYYRKRKKVRTAHHYIQGYFRNMVPENSVGQSVHFNYFMPLSLQTKYIQFLDASTHHYKRVCPFVCPSVRPSVCPSVQPSIHPTDRPSIHPSIRPFVRPSVCPSVAHFFLCGN